MPTSQIDPFGLPPEQALEWFRAKGYVISWDWRDTWQIEHSQAFTVAKVMRRDILADIRTAIDEALANGTTLAQFKRDLIPLLQSKGWWGRKEEVDPVTGEVKEVQLGSPRRLKIIYDTNLRQAHSAGRWQTIQRLKVARPYLRYIHRHGKTPSPGSRPQHQKWHDVVMLVDDPNWDSIMPMNGWYCHCKVQQLNERDLKRHGLSVSKDLALQKIAWTNSHTGETSMVTVGVDPGFDYNPGKRRFVPDAVGA